jgi:hypothetical protein
LFPATCCCLLLPPRMRLALGISSGLLAGGRHVPSSSD